MSTNGGELASWKSDQKLSFAMLQAREAVAEVAEDPRNRKAAKLSRANSIMKALDDVGTLGQPMTSWQKRAAATGGLGATQFNQQFASLPRARVNSRPSSGGSGITRGFSQSSGSIGRSDSDERTSIQRSLRFPRSQIPTYFPLIQLRQHRSGISFMQNTCCRHMKNPLCHLRNSQHTPFLSPERAFTLAQ